MTTEDKTFHYNTDREPLIIPEYGRYIHEMVAYLKTIEDRDKRNKNALAVINLLGRQNPHLRDVPDFQHKLWDHLFIMAGFDLDVDSPFPKPSPEKLKATPEKLPYPKKGYQFRFYGHIIKKMIDEAVKWEEGELKDKLIQTIANHMKKNYLTWNKDSVSDDVIFEHLRILSDGQINLNSQDNELRSANQLVKRKKYTNNSQKHKNYRKNR
ncbi:MAG TPA: DUF4290 domain-containing protein [Flavobacteriales bacterium]|nr:DUF4290 domain-containing protein [Flavobacteriales bacterium]